MKRNSRNRSLWLMAGAALAAAVVPSIYYVWGHTQIVTLGYRIEAARQRLKELEDLNRVLVLERAELRSLARIDIKARRLGLAPAAPDRIIVIQPVRRMAE